MKKIVFIITALLIFGSVNLFTAFAQDLQDVEVVNKNAEEIYITKYGYLVEYPTTDLYKANLFVPYSWFRPNKDGEERGIVGRRKVTYHNIDVPSFEVTYLDAAVKYVTLLVPKHYIETGFPMYYGDLSEEELKAGFDEQKGKTTLDLK